MSLMRKQGLLLHCFFLSFLVWSSFNSLSSMCTASHPILLYYPYHASLSLTLNIKTIKLPYLHICQKKSLRRGFGRVYRQTNSPSLYHSFLFFGLSAGPFWAQQYVGQSMWEMCQRQQEVPDVGITVFWQVRVELNIKVSLNKQCLNLLTK